MKVRAVVLCLSVAAAALFAGASRAHDPAEFERRVDRAVLLPPEADEASDSGESKPADPQVL